MPRCSYSRRSADVEQFLKGRAVVREGRHPDRQLPRDRNLHRGASLRDARLDAANDRPRALGGLLAEQQGELVAADAADHVVGAGRFLHQAGDGLDQLVPHQVALGVVDRLQPAHVHVGEHERTLVAAGTRELALGGLGEPATVEDAGECVGQGCGGDGRKLLLAAAGTAAGAKREAGEGEHQGERGAEREPHRGRDHFHDVVDDLLAAVVIGWKAEPPEDGCFLAEWWPDACVVAAAAAAAAVPAAAAPAGPVPVVPPAVVPPVPPFAFGSVAAELREPLPWVRSLIAELEDLTMLWRLLVSGVLDGDGVVEVDVGAGVGSDAGVVDETGLIVPVEASFTGVAGTEASEGVVTEPMLRLVLDAVDEPLEGSEAGTAPLLPVTPSQRPWQLDVVEPEPVVPGCRPWPLGELLASRLAVVVVPLVVVVPAVVVPGVVVVAVVVVPGVVVVAVVVVPVVVVLVFVVVPVVVVPVVVVPVVVVSVGVVDVSVVEVVSVVVGVVVVAVVVVVDASVVVGGGRGGSRVVAAAVEAGSVVAGVVVVPVRRRGELTLGVIASTTCSGRAVSQRETLEPDLLKVVDVGPIACARAADSEDRTTESDRECDRADSLAAVNHRRPLTGPLHARPPASWFEVGLHARRHFTSQGLFRQMSEGT